MELLIILLLILLNGIFSMSEMALVSARKFKLASEQQKGSFGAHKALHLSDNPNVFLSTVQIGITLISILVGIFSGNSIMEAAASFIAQVAYLAPYATQIASVAVVILVTFVSIVVGELLPKRIGMAYPEKISMIMAAPMTILSRIASPFVWLLTKTNDLFLSFLGLNKVSSDAISEDEIKSILKESAEGGEISSIEQDIVERVFELGDTQVDHIFTHKNDVVFFTLEDTWEEIKQKIFEHKHAAYPICKHDDLDTVVGIVTLKDLITPNFSKDFNIESIIKEPLYINENAFAFTVLEQFIANKMHYGMVVDEYGAVQGVITMDDVVGTLVGNVTDRVDNDLDIVARDARSWLVNGQCNLKHFFKQFPLEIDPESYEEYNTVAGLVLSQTETLPKIGSLVIIAGYSFEVIDKDGQRIDKILLTKLEDDTTGA